MKAANRPLFVGIDGGASKTTLLASAGVGFSVKEIQIGPTNPDVVGWGVAVARLTASIRRLVGEHPIRKITLGLAGIDSITDSSRLQRELIKKLKLAKNTVRVENDIITGMAAGTKEHNAAAFIAGSGAHALARGPRGSHLTTGFGPLLGDDGSGYMLGRLALRAVTAASDGRGPSTTLTRRLKKYWHAITVSQLQDRAEAADKTTIAGSALTVVAAADAGDRVARALITQTAQAGASALIAASQQAGLRGKFPVVLIGSLFFCRRYAVSFQSAVRMKFPRAQFKPLRRSPAFGALELSYGNNS